MSEVFNSAQVGGFTSGSVSNMIVLSEPYFTNLHVGCCLRIRDEAAATYKYCVIQTVVSGQVAQVWWATAPPALYARTVYWEEMAYGINGGFLSVAIWEGRLVFGGVTGSGTSIWMSRAGGFRNFDLGSAADADGIAATARGGVRNIIHLVPAVGSLLVFTDNGVMSSPIQANQPVTPTTFRLNPISEYAAATAILPTAFDGGVIFAQAVSGAVRDVALSPSGESISVTPLSLAVPSILGVPVDLAVQSAIAGRPEQYAFFVNAAGGMAVLHSIREQQVSAWVRWTTNGAWKSVCCVSGRVFTAVERNGRLRLEVFDPALAFDAAVTGERMNRAEHLQGMVAHAASGTSYFGSELVGAHGWLTQGQWVLGAIEIGLAFEWFIEPLPPILDMPGQTLTNRAQRVVKTSLLLHRARTVSVSGDTMVLRTDGFLMDADSARSGWWTARHLGWSRRDEPMIASLRITRDVPLPCGVLSMIREIAA